MGSHKTFRTDINGLRAYTVLTVVLFHFNIPGFSAGIISVGVFCMILGSQSHQLRACGNKTQVPLFHQAIYQG
jgi:hypothetical protein